jgi:hypothetical protein
MGRWVFTEKRVTDEGYKSGRGKERKPMDRWKIRVLGRVVGSMEKKILASDRYHQD